MERLSDDKKNLTVETYNKTAHAMAQKFNSIGARTEDIQQVLAFVKKQNPRILEIGCGNGRDAEEIMRHTTDYSAFDISEGMIRIARESVPQAHLSVADVETYNFERGIDVVFAFASLLHTPREELQKILQRVYSALNPGGVFFISVKCGEYQEVLKSDEFGERYFYLYTPVDIIQIAGNQYKVLGQKITELRGQYWTEVLLQK